MSLRILWRALGAIAVVGVLASVPALSLTLGASPSAMAPRDEDQPFAQDWWIDPHAADDAEPDDAEPDDAAGAESTQAGDDGGAAAAGSGATGTADPQLPGFSFQLGLRTPESQASVFAAVNAYRTSRGIPAFLAGEPDGNYQCVWPGVGGTIWPGTIAPSESFARAIPRLFPAAASYQGPPGTVTVGLVGVESFIDSATGRVWPSESASIVVKYCSPPTPPPVVKPPPPPVEPPPVEPPPPPPTEPSAPPADPSAPPAEPVPTP